MRIITHTLAFALLITAVGAQAARIEVVTLAKIGDTPSVHHSREVRSTPCSLEEPTRTYSVGKGGDDDIKLHEGEDVAAVITGIRVGSRSAWTFRNIGKHVIKIYSGTRLVTTLEQNKSIIMTRGHLYKMAPTTYVRLK